MDRFERVGDWANEKRNDHAARQLTEAFERGVRMGLELQAKTQTGSAFLGEHLERLRGIETRLKAALNEHENRMRSRSSVERCDLGVFLKYILTGEDPE